MTDENGEKFWSSRWYKISFWSAKIQMHLGQGRSSHGSCSKNVLKNFAIFTKNHLCWTLLFVKFINKSVFLWILQNFKNPILEDLRTAASDKHTNNICFLFLEKCLLPKPNFSLFRFFSIFFLEVSIMN